MRKLFYISTVFLVLAVQKTTFASSNTINSQDFQYLVCSYIEDSSSLEDALDNINNVIDKLTISDSQEETMQQLADQTLTSESYCVGLEF